MSIYVDPPREMFSWTVPFLNRPILWYGALFAAGFFLGYYLFLFFIKQYLLSSKSSKQATIESRNITEGLLIASIVGTVVGARLGDVLFYQNINHLLQDPFSIFRVWEGGLASHGGAIGVLIAVAIYSRKVKQLISFKRILDLIAIPAALIGVFIRIGNFINQEILGTASSLPWAVVFGHPADRSEQVPRHPVQLYEAFSYFLIFWVLYFLWRKDCKLLKPGRLFGSFLILVFGARFFLEFVKLEQSHGLMLPFLHIGQYLSIPFILLGVYFLSCKK